MNYITKLKKYNNKLRYSLSGGANLGVNIGNKALDVIVMCAQKNVEEYSEIDSEITIRIYERFMQGH